MQPSIYPSKSRGKQILLKTTHLSDYFMYHFPRVFKKEITMRFPRQLSHASFSRGLRIFVKKVQLALLDAIQFLVSFSKYSTRVTVLQCKATFGPLCMSTQTIIVTFVMTQHFENIVQKSGNFRGQVPFNFDSQVSNFISSYTLFFL